MIQQCILALGHDWSYFSTLSTLTLLKLTNLLQVCDCFQEFTSDSHKPITHNWWFSNLFRGNDQIQGCFLIYAYSLGQVLLNSLIQLLVYKWWYNERKPGWLCSISQCITMGQTWFFPTGKLQCQFSLKSLIFRKLSWKLLFLIWFLIIVH